MEAVQVVTEKADADAEAIAKRFLDTGHAIAIGVAKKPQIGDVGIPDVAIPREDACPDTIEGGVELLGENGRAVGFAIAIGIFNELNALAVIGVTVEPVTEMPFHFGEAVIDSAAGQFLAQPIHALPGVFDTCAESKGFADLSASFFIGVKRDRVGTPLFWRPKTR